MSAPPAPLERIVLVHPGALGDFVQALPAFERLRAAHPAARVTLVTGDEIASLARAVAPVDEVLAFSTRTAYHGGALARARLLAGLMRAVRRCRPDAVALFKAAPIYAVIAAASGATQRVGLARGAGGSLLTTRVPLRADEHREDRYAAVAAALGANYAAPPSRWPEAGASAALLPALAEGAPLVGIAPGGARNGKEEMVPRRWPADRFAELAVELRRVRADAHVVLLGGAGDRREADRVLTALPTGAATDLVGRTSVLEAQAVIARLSLLVTNDAGLLHVAATTDTPIVAVFGPSDPREACPRRPGIVSCWRPAREVPCLDARDGRLQACVTPCCIERVSVSEVLTEALGALRLSPTGARPQPCAPGPSAAR